MATNPMNLADYFVSAQRILLAVILSKEQANYTDKTAVENFHSVKKGHFLNPGDIPEDLQTQLAQHSVSAHIQRAQAEQVNIAGSQELEAISLEARSGYINKKVVVTAKNRSTKPILSYWLDKQTGNYSAGRRHPGKIKGKVAEIKLEANLLIIKPTIAKKIFYRSLWRYVVYVVDPSNLEPNVEISLV